MSVVIEASVVRDPKVDGCLISLCYEKIQMCNKGLKAAVVLNKVISCSLGIIFSPQLTQLLIVLSTSIHLCT